MNQFEKSRSIALARTLVDELGGQSAAARYFGLRQPSISLWCAKGVGLVRENDLRLRFPGLAAWSKFPPVDLPKGVAARD